MSHNREAFLMGAVFGGLVVADTNSNMASDMTAIEKQRIRVAKQLVEFKPKETQ